MMKDLLELYFGQHYQSTKQVLAEIEVKSGLFSFADPKACRDCKEFTPGHEADCDKVVVKIDSQEHDIECIQLEQFIDNFHNLKAMPSEKKCDLLLVNENKIVLCDMTCSKAKYIDPSMMQDGTENTGKRNKVRKQIKNSIALLYNVPEIASEINKKSERIALFAYRVKEEVVKDDFDRKMMSGIRSFGIKQEKLSQEPMYSDMENGFVFTEVRYPDTFAW